MTKIEQCNEAIKRLELLHSRGLLNEVLRAFKESGDIYIFERQNYFLKAVSYSLNLNSSKDEYKQLKEKISEIEKEYECMVYLVQKSHTEFGVLYALFCVSKHKNEWDMDMQDLENNCSLCYVWNSTDDFLSEFGTIGFDYSMGGIYRTW